MSTVSVIIPTLNEVESLPRCLSAIRAEFRGELIVVDGGSTDGTAGKAMELSARVYTSPKGLASQCNEGAREAMGDVLLFVSADSELQPGWLSKIREIMASPEVVGGGFSLSLDHPGAIYKLLSFGGNFRSRYLGIALPDQGLFVRRRALESVGGFRENSRIPFAFACHELKRHGEIVLTRHPIRSSVRKWESRGLLQTTWEHALTYLKYRYAELPHHA